MFAQVACVILVFAAVVESNPAPGGRAPQVEWKTTYMPPTCNKRSNKGDVLTTNYIGYFPDGKKFDSTYDRKEPMKYTMGDGEVIKGAEIGDMNMCVGEKRHVVIPPELGYGYKDYAQIPAGSTLVFDTVLVKLENNPMAEMGLMANADGSFPLFT